MFIQNCWYVAAWDYEVLGVAMFHRKILGKSILFYRTAAGAVIALDNLCSHRLAPLSMGRREGDCVRCMYHGVKYNHFGQCVEVPGQKTTPDALRVRAYPIVEKDRWIWIWMGDPEKANPALLPDTYALKHPDWRMKPGYMLYRANHLLISDNLLDFSHLSYVHEHTLGGTNTIAEVRPEIERRPDGVRIIRRVDDTVPAPYQVRLGRFAGNVNRYWIYDYLIPGILLMDAGVTPVASPDAASGASLEFRSCQAITPETESSTHYFFMQAHGFSLDDATVTESIYQSVIAAFTEDRRMIEAQQEAIDAQPSASMVALPFDSAPAYFRTLIDRLLDRESSSVSH